MKKILLLFLLICFLITLSSCVTSRQHGFWQAFPPVPFFYNYQIENVSVIIDHVREDNISKQVFLIAETHLASRQQEYQKYDKTLFLDINVEQRSFMQNMDMYNSIFVSFAAYDEEGTIYVRINEYISGKQTFVAAAQQNTIITRILNRILREQQKRYNDIQKYERGMQREAQRQ
jgi:hypothetical protein